MTCLRVPDGGAVNHGQYLDGGVLLDVEDRLAARWLERQLVLTARELATKAAPKKATRKTW